MAAGSVVLEDVPLGTRTLVSGVATERVLMQNNIIKQLILGDAVVSVGDQTTIAATLIAIGATVAIDAAATTGGITASGLILGTVGGVAAGIALVFAGAFWLGWLMYCQTWVEYFRKMSEITVWTDYDTKRMAKSLEHLDDEEVAKTLICERMMLDVESFIGEFPSDPMGRAVYGAGLALVARIHNMWPLKKGVSKETIVKWMVRQYNFDLSKHAELVHAFAVPINEIRNTTKKMYRIMGEIKELKDLHIDRLECAEDIPRVVLIGKTGAGKSTLGNLLVDGRFIDYDDCSDDDSSDEKDPTQEAPFNIADGGDACSTEVTMLRSKGDFAAYIIDTPGLCDTKGRDSVFQQKVVTALQSVGRVSCFILCMKIDERATDEFKRNVIQFLSEQYGSEVWSHTILVLTHCSSKKKRKKTQDELLLKNWLPLECPNLPAKVISMDNEEESTFGNEKLTELFEMIAQMDLNSMESDHFQSELMRKEKEVSELEPILEKQKAIFKEWAEDDVYIVNSIERKQAVMRDQEEYKIEDMEERLSQCPDLDTLEDTNPLMIEVIQKLKQETEDTLAATRAAVAEVARVLKETEKKKKK